MYYIELNLKKNVNKEFKLKSEAEVKFRTFSLTCVRPSQFLAFATFYHNTLSILQGLKQIQHGWILD